MNDEDLRESVSALADGELAPAPARRALDAVLSDPALRVQWRRQFTISAVLTGQTPVESAGPDLADRVRVALAHEPQHILPLRAPARRRRLVALTAVAASLTVMALGVGLVVHQAPEGPQAIAGGSAGPSPAVRTQMVWADARPAVEARLNGYLLNHNEYLAGGVRGMLPYARVVGYDARN